MCSSNARFCVSLVTPDATTNISNEAFQLSYFVAKPEMSVVLNSKGGTPANPPRFTNRQCHKPQNKLKIITINVNGLKGIDKKAAFHVFIDTEQPDVILGQESKLDSSYSNSEIFPPGYNKNVFRKDRDTHGGGVFIAVRDELDVTEISVCRECPLVLVKLRVIGRPPPHTYRFFLSASRT